MLNKLEVFFIKYAESVQSRLEKITSKDVAKGALKLLRNKKRDLLSYVSELEEDIVFKNLIEETINIFSKTYHKNGELGWTDAIKTFFRRSGFYCDIFYNRHIVPSLFFNYYCNEFQKTENKIYYFAPMEFVALAEPCIDFREFQVRRFSAVDLEKYFPSRIYELFYPWAIIDTSKLQNYWFIYFINSIPARRLGETSLNDFKITDDEWEELDEILSQVHIEFTEYPNLLLPFIKRLALFDWKTDWDRKYSKDKNHNSGIYKQKSWKGFNIPFVIQYSDDLLSTPNEAPETYIFEKLETEPYEDVHTGKDVGEGPLLYFDLDKDETNIFNDFINHITNILNELKLKQNSWLFLETSLNFFIKGFFSKGIEQMLWHIISLEALLGEKGEGVTDRLSQRISSILGENEDQMKAIKKRFKELYNFRCELVHGSTSFSKQIYIGHLTTARDLSRKTILWFLNYLYEIKREFPNIIKLEKMPKRKDILKVLDRDKSCNINLMDLMNRLPKGFPYVKEWLE